MTSAPVPIKLDPSNLHDLVTLHEMCEDYKLAGRAKAQIQGLPDLVQAAHDFMDDKGFDVEIELSDDPGISATLTINF